MRDPLTYQMLRDYAVHIGTLHAHIAEVAYQLAIMRAGSDNHVLDAALAKLVAERDRFKKEQHDSYWNSLNAVVAKSDGESL